MWLDDAGPAPFTEDRVGESRYMETDLLGNVGWDILEALEGVRGVDAVRITEENCGVDPLVLSWREGGRDWLCIAEGGREGGAMGLSGAKKDDFLLLGEGEEGIWAIVSIARSDSEGLEDLFVCVGV